MSEGVQVNTESLVSIEIKDDTVPAITEQPPPAGDVIAGEPAAPDADNAGLNLVLNVRQKCQFRSVKFSLTNISYNPLCVVIFNHYFTKLMNFYFNLLFYVSTFSIC